VKLFDFFREWILIRLTYNLSHFVSSSVEILMWNFRKNLFRENFSEIFAQTKAIIHYRNLWNSALLFAIFNLRPYCAKKFTQVLSYVVCTQVRRHAHKQITKRRYGEENRNILFTENLFCSLSVWDLLCLTPWVFWSEIFSRRSSLCLLSLGWDLSPRFVPKDSQ